MALGIRAEEDEMSAWNGLAVADDPLNPRRTGLGHGVSGPAKPGAGVSSQAVSYKMLSAAALARRLTGQDAHERGRHEMN